MRLLDQLPSTNVEYAIPASVHHDAVINAMIFTAFLTAFAIGIFFILAIQIQEWMELDEKI